jgi:hypothetical protein
MTIVRRLAAAFALATLALAAPTPTRAAGPLDTFGTAPASSGSTGFEQGPRRTVGEDPVRFVVQVGADFGLTTAVPLVFEDGTEQDLMYNQGASIGVGLVGLSLADGLLGTQATIGVEYSTVAASNGSVRWLAFPLEVMEVVNLYPLRLGAGLSCLLAPTVKGDGEFSGIDAELKTSFGVLLEGSLIFRNENNPRHPAWWIGVRYEINRVQNTLGGPTDDANAVGLVLGGAL